MKELRRNAELDAANKGRNNPLLLTTTDCYTPPVAASHG